MSISPPLIGSRPGQHAQQGRLAAARRADQHHELAVGDVEADAVDDLEAAEVFSILRKETEAMRLILCGQLLTAPAVRPPTM
jgi:hypothetical protein